MTLGILKTIRDYIQEVAERKTLWARLSDLRHLQEEVRRKVELMSLGDKGTMSEEERKKALEETIECFDECDYIFHILERKACWNRAWTEIRGEIIAHWKGCLITAIIVVVRLFSYYVWGL